MKNFFIVFVLTFVFMGLYGCEKNTDSIALRKTLVDEIVQAPRSYFFVDPAYKEKFKSLSSNELVYYMEQMADKITKINLEEEKDEFDRFKLKEEEIYQIYHTFLKQWNKNSLEQFKVEMHQLTDQQANEVFDHIETWEILESLDDSFQKRACEFWTNREQGDSEDGFEQNSRTCSQYSYFIPSNQSSSGNHGCIGVYSATYLNDPDCDYEFVFHWPYLYSPSLVKLYSSSFGGRSVLNLGSINGRIQLSSNDDTIRFLIGKNRVNWLGGGKTSFKNNLYGYW